MKSRIKLTITITVAITITITVATNGNKAPRTAARIVAIASGNERRQKIQPLPSKESDCEHTENG